MIKQSVAVAIFRPDDRRLVILVQRPADDEDLEAVLPAAEQVSLCCRLFIEYTATLRSSPR